MPSGSVMAIAHRGASAYAPENTIAAFEEALRLHARAVEMDVRLSRDGVPVILHDATVERTTDGRGPVDQLTVDELQSLDAGSWKDPQFAGVRIPTLDEALAVLAGKARPILELKADLDPQLLEDILRRYRLERTALIISFAEPRLVAVRKHSRDLQVGLLAHAWTPDLPQRCAALGAQVLDLNNEVLSLERVAAAEAQGVEVWCYTVNDVGLAAACAAMGVKGITTDRPDLIREKL
jgi:glycerophosphoryl diester phosphodiesterase